MKKEVKTNSSIVVFLGLILSFNCLVGFSLAKDEAGQPSFPEIEAALKEAERVLMEQERARVLPIAESENNGYWWNKQNKDTKQKYIMQLIELFGLEDKNLKIAEIMQKLDILYNPKDNPLDIKIDISVERAFSEVIK